MLHMNDPAILILILILIDSRQAGFAFGAFEPVRLFGRRARSRQVGVNADGACAGEQVRAFFVDNT
jgi:hypothetical protein